MKRGLFIAPVAALLAVCNAAEETLHHDSFRLLFMSTMNPTAALHPEADGVSS
jgi:hypothetical protein